MNSVRTYLGSAVLSVAMGAGALAVGVPALAAADDTASLAECSGNRTCTFDGSYTDFLGSRTPGSPREVMSVGARNRLSSWINYTSTGSRFYYNTTGNNDCVPMYANDRASASAGNPDNNQAESWAFTRVC